MDLTPKVPDPVSPAPMKTALDNLDEKFHDILSDLKEAQSNLLSQSQADIDAFEPVQKFEETYSQFPNLVND